MMCYKNCTFYLVCIKKLIDKVRIEKNDAIHGRKPNTNCMNDANGSKFALFFV